MCGLKNVIINLFHVFRQAVNCRLYTENFSLYFTAKFTTNFIMFGDKLEQFAIYQILSVMIEIFEI